MQFVFRLKQHMKGCTCLEIAGLALTAADERACSPDLGKVPVMAYRRIQIQHKCHCMS